VALCDELLSPEDALKRITKGLCELPVHRWASYQRTY